MVEDNNESKVEFNFAKEHLRQISVLVERLTRVELLKDPFLMKDYLFAIYGLLRSELKSLTYTYKDSNGKDVIVSKTLYYEKCLYFYSKKLNPYTRFIIKADGVWVHKVVKGCPPSYLKDTFVTLHNLIHLKWELYDDMNKLGFTLQNVNQKQGGEELLE